MGTYTDCLRQVIGISKNPCICYNDGDLPEYSQSLSGLYMDDYLFGLPLSFPAAVHECDHPTLWDLMVESREQGIQRFMSEFGQAVITNRNRKRYQQFAGYVGGQKKTGLGAAATYHVMEVTPKFEGSTLKINSVTVRGQELIVGTALVFLLNEEMVDAADTSQPLETYVGTFTSAGVAVCTPNEPTTFELDCSASERYFIVWFNNVERAPFTVAMDRETGCGCGGQRKRIAGWDPYVYATSYPLTDLTQWATAKGNASYTEGIQLNASFTCDAMFLCDSIDYENDPFGRAIATLIVLYSNRQLIGHMLMSDKVNVYTAARSEEMIERDAILKEEIIQRLPWPARNLPSSAESCYICNPRQRRRSNLI